MPDKEGIETILELRRESPGLKIIAVSGGAESHLQMVALLGASRTFSKPLNMQEFLDAVRETLGLARPGSCGVVLEDKPKA